MIAPLLRFCRAAAAPCAAALALVIAGCAPLPPVEPLPPRRPASAPQAEIPAKQRLYGQPTPTPTRIAAILREQEIDETAEHKPAELPPPDALPEGDGVASLEPQIKAAKAPNTAAALRMVDKGRALIDQQKYDDALEQLQRAVSVDPSNFYGYYYLAKAHRQTQDYSQAIAFANRATALGSQTDRAWLARAYTLQGEIFERVGRFSDARAAYKRAVDADPNNLTAYVGKARLSPQQQPTPVHEDPWR